MWLLHWVLSLILNNILFVPRSFMSPHMVWISRQPVHSLVDIIFCLFCNFNKMSVFQQTSKCHDMLKSILSCPLVFQRGFGQTRVPLVKHRTIVLRMATRRPSRTQTAEAFNIASAVESTPWEDVGMEDPDSSDLEQQKQLEESMKQGVKPRSTSKRRMPMQRTASAGSQEVMPSSSAGMPTMEQMQAMLDLMRQQGVLPETEEQASSNKT